MAVGVRNDDATQSLLGVFAVQLPPQSMSIEDAEPVCTLEAIASSFEGAINFVGLITDNDCTGNLSSGLLRFLLPEVSFGRGFLIKPCLGGFLLFLLIDWFQSAPVGFRRLASLPSSPKQTFLKLNVLELHFLKLHVLKPTFL